MPSVLLPSRISAPGSHGGAGELQAGSALLDGADVLAVGVRAGSAPEPAAERAAQAYGVDLAAVLREEKVAGRAGEVVRVPVRVDGLPPRLLLVGAGNATPEDLRRAGAALARATRGRSRVVAALESPGPAGPAAEGTRALVEGLFLGGYRVPAQGLKNRADGAPAADVQLVGTHSPQAVEQGLVHGRATWLARDLTNTPSNVKNPPWLAERAAELAEQAGLRAEIWDGQRLEAEGSGDCSQSAAGRRPRRGWCAWTTARAGTAGPAGTSGRWCSSARGSRSTPAACPSSRARRWSR
jgi:leucyl aminopeptidase